MIENKNFKQIYDFLSSQFNVGTIHDFKERMKNEKNRKHVHSMMSSVYNVGTYDEFEANIGLKKKVTPTLSPYRTFESENTVDFDLNSVETYNPYEIENRALGKTISQHLNSPIIPQVKRWKDGNYMEVMDNEGNVMQSSHLMSAEVDPVSGKPVVFPTLFPKVDNPSSEVEDWMQFEDNYEALKHAKSVGEVYYGYPQGGGGEIPFDSLNEAIEWSKGGYKELKTWREHYDMYVKWLEQNPNITDEIKKTVGDGIKRRFKVNAIKEDARRAVALGSDPSTISKMANAIKDGVVHDLVINTLGTFGAEIEQLFTGGKSDRIFNVLSGMAENQQQKDLVAEYIQYYKTHGIGADDKDLKETLDNGLFKNIFSGEFDKFVFGMGMLGVQTMRMLPSAIAIMYGGGALSRAKVGGKALGLVKGTIGAGTAYGYTHSVLDEYMQDKDISGKDRIESVARGLVEGLSEVAFMGNNYLVSGLGKRLLGREVTKKTRKELVKAYMRPWHVTMGRGMWEEGLEEYIASIGNAFVDWAADGVPLEKALGKGHREGLDQMLVGMGAGGIISGGAAKLSSITMKNDTQTMEEELRFINSSLIDPTISNSTKLKLREKKDGIYNRYFKMLSKRLINYNSLSKGEINKAINAATEIKELNQVNDELSKKKGFVKLINSNIKKIDELQKTIDEATSKGAAGQIIAELKKKVTKASDIKSTPKVAAQVEKEKKISEISFDNSTSKEAGEYVKSTGFGNLLGGIVNLLKSTKNITLGGNNLKINFYKSNSDFSKVSGKNITPKKAGKIGGRWDDKTNTVHFNLEALRNIDPSQAKVTLLHEVFHPLVEKMIAENPKGLEVMANYAKKDKGIKEYIGGISGKTQETLDKEAVTEYLARVASGDIKPTLTLIESFKQTVIDALSAIGIKLPQTLDFEINTEQEFKDFASRLANTLKSGREFKVGVRGKDKPGNKILDEDGNEIDEFFTEPRLDPKEEEDKLRDLSKSDAFKKWFGESKAVDINNGIPLVLYHGTKSDWYEYDISKAGTTGQDYYGAGIYTTPNPNIANIFTGDSREYRGQVYPLFMSVQNPLILSTSPRTKQAQTELTDNEIESLILNSPNLEATLRGQVEYMNHIKSAILEEESRGVSLGKIQQEIRDNMINITNSTSSLYQQFVRTDRTTEDVNEMLKEYRVGIVDFYKDLYKIRLTTESTFISADTQGNTGSLLKNLDYSFYRTPNRLERDIDGTYIPKVSVDFEKAWSSKGVQQFHQALNNLGYDGVFADVNKSSDKGKYNVYIAFNPNQIKSIYNTGFWSQTDDNILHRVLDKQRKKIKPFEEKTPPSITAVVEGDETKNIIIAPYFEQTIESQEEAAVVRESASYKTYVQSLRNLGEQMGFSALVDDIIGGYENDAGTKIVEVSNIVRLVKTQSALSFPPTIEQAEEYAAMAATLAPEIQEATIAGQYVEDGSENHNANEYKIYVGRDNINPTIEALREAKIYNYSINEDEGSVAFIDVFDFQDVDLSKKIGTFVQELDKREVNHDKKEYAPIDSRYISRGDRQTIFKRIESTGSINEENRPDLYQTFSLVKERDNYSEEGFFRILTEKQAKSFYHRSLRYRKGMPINKDSWASAFNIQRGLIEKYVRGKGVVSFGEYAEDIMILARYNLYKSSKKVSRDFHNAILPLIQDSIPTIEDIKRAKKLADELIKKYKGDEYTINEIAGYIALYPNVDVSKLSKEEIQVIMEDVHGEEVHEIEINAIDTFFKEIKQKTEDIQKKLGEKELDSKFELKAIKSFLVRKAEEIISKKTKSEKTLKEYVLTDSDIKVIEKALINSTLPIKDITEIINNIKTNRKLLGNVAKNQIRKSNTINNINSLLKKSRKKLVDYYDTKNPILNVNVTMNEWKTIDAAFPKGGFTKIQIKVLNDTFENHEVDKLLTTLESLISGYMPPSTYSRILKKLANTVKAIEFISSISELKLLVDDTGRWIRDPKARADYWEKEDLGWIRKAIDEGNLKKKFENKMSTSAFPLFGKIKDKALKKLFILIGSPQGTAEGYKKKINRQKEILFGKKGVKFSVKFEGKTYRREDLNILGHMYMLHKQFDNNPLSSRVPELYTSLIKTRTGKNDVESQRIISLWKDFKKTNATIIDIAKLERLFKKARYMNVIKFARKTFNELQDMVAYLQKYRYKEKVQIFSDYVPVINLKDAPDIEAAFSATILSVFNPSEKSPARTTIARQVYKTKDGIPTKPPGQRMAHFDLDRAISFAVHETIDDYYVREGSKDVEMILKIGRKLGDTKTRSLLKLLGDMVSKKLKNNYTYINNPGLFETTFNWLSNNIRFALLANIRRYVELGTNTIMLVGQELLSGKIFLKQLTPTKVIDTYKTSYKVTQALGSSFKERFQPGGLSYFDLEKIKGSPLESFIKDKKLGSLAIGRAIHEVSEATGLFSKYGQWLIRMPDVHLSQAVWGMLFENEFKRITKKNFDTNNLKDKRWVANHISILTEAKNNTDIIVLKTMPAVKFDMDIISGSRQGIAAQLGNLFITFRKNIAATLMNAWRSLLGLRGGDMTKGEALSALTTVNASLVLYGVWSKRIMGLVASMFTMWLGGRDDDDEEKIKKERIGWVNGIAEAIMFNTVLGRWNSLGYSFTSSYVRGVGREYVEGNLKNKNGIEQLKATTDGFMKSMNYGPAFGGTIHPLFQYPFTVVSAVSEWNKASDENKDVAMWNAAMTLAQLGGTPHSSDLKIIMGGYLKNNRVGKKYTYNPNYKLRKFNIDKFKPRKYKP